MPSLSLQRWNAEAAVALDRMEAAHRAFRHAAVGRRYTTQQINQSYLVLLSSHFQRFCRDLHTEAIDELVKHADQSVRGILRSALRVGRKLDQGNPNPGNLGADFGRLGMTFWADVSVLDRRSQHRLKVLEAMGRWRNAIAHQDFESQAHALGHRHEVSLLEVRSFRRACNGLAASFDRAVRAYITTIVGQTGGW